MNTPNRTVQFKYCLGINDTPLLKRAVFVGPEQSREALKKVPVETPAPIEWNKITAETIFDEDPDKVFKDLAEKAGKKEIYAKEIYAAEIRETLTALLPPKFAKLGNGDKIKGLWKVLGENDRDENGEELDTKCAKVEINNGVLSFKDSSDREIVFRKDSVPVKINIQKPSTGSDVSETRSTPPAVQTDAVNKDVQTPAPRQPEQNPGKPNVQNLRTPTNAPTLTTLGKGETPSQTDPREKAAQEYFEKKAKGTRTKFNEKYWESQRRILSNYTTFQGTPEQKSEFYNANSDLTALANAGQEAWNDAWNRHEFKNLDRVKQISTSFFPEISENALRDITFLTYKESAKTGRLNADKFIEAAKIYFVKDVYNESQPGTLEDLEKNNLETVRNGVIFMLEAMSHLTLTGEIAPNRPTLKWTTPTRRLNEIFAYNGVDDTTTMEDVAGGKNKKLGYKILPWLPIPEGIPLISPNGEKRNIFEDGAQDASAFARTVQESQDKNGEINTKKFVENINAYLFHGVQSLRTNASSLKLGEVFEKIGIAKPDSLTDEAPFEQLYNKLTITENSINEKSFGKSAEEFAAFKDLVKLGYMVDSRAAEGKISRNEAEFNSKETDPAKLSEIRVIRQSQLIALQKGYPGTPQEIEDHIKAANKTIGGVLIQRNPDGSWSFGAGVAIVDLGYGFNLGIGASVTEGTGNFMIGVAKGDIETGTIGVGAGLNTKAQADLGIGGAIDFVNVPVPMDEASYNFFVSGAAGLSLRSGLNAGVMAGLRWNPADAVEKGHSKELAKKGLDQIEAAYQKNDIAAVALMMHQHPAFGKTIDLLSARYLLNDEDVYNMYQQVRLDLKNLSVEQLNNPNLLGFLPISSIGVGAGINIDSKGFSIGPIFLLTIPILKTTYLFRSESRTPQAMRAGLDARLNQWAAKTGFTVNEATKPLTIHEGDQRLARRLDGKLAMGVKEKTTDLSYLNPSKLEDINKSLEGQGIHFEAAPQKPGFLKVVIDALDPSNPANALRTTRVFIDPGLKDKGLFLDGREIYLRTSANPKLFLKRIDYITPKNQDGSPTHTEVILSDNPARTLNEVTNRESQKYILCLPGGEMSVARSGQNVEQSNVMYFAEYQARLEKNPKLSEQFGAYNEFNFDKHKEAANRRLQSFEQLGNKVRPELTQGPNNFTDKFYAKHHTEFKLYTTTPTVNPKALVKLIQSEFKDTPPINIDELNVIITRLTELSWSDTSKKGPKEREALFNQRREWAKAILTPIWDKRMTALKTKGVKFQHSAKELVAIAVDGTKDTKMDEIGTHLPEGSVAMTTAGTEGINGERSYINPEVLLGISHYEQFLGQPNEQGEIARLIMEGLSPLPDADAEFMESPLALKLYRQVALVLVMGPENFDKVTECFNTGKITAANQEAFAQFRNIAETIRNGQKEHQEKVSVSIDGKTCSFILKPLEIATGIDKKCTNFSTYVTENFDIELPQDRATVAGVRAFDNTNLRSAVRADITSAGIGFTVMSTHNKPERGLPSIPAPKTNQNNQDSGSSVHTSDGTPSNSQTPDQPQLGTGSGATGNAGIKR